MLKPKYKLVRENFVITSKYLRENGESIVEARIQETKYKAKTIARRIGIYDNNMDIDEFYDLHTVNAFSEYLMSLLGPAAVRPKNWKEWLIYGPCRYSVIVRDKSES